MPLLIEPLGATLIAYRRTEVLKFSGVAGGPPEAEQISDNEEDNHERDSTEIDSGVDG